jgi:hypothetical protein
MLPKLTAWCARRRQREQENLEEDAADRAELDEVRTRRRLLGTDQWSLAPSIGLAASLTALPVTAYRPRPQGSFATTGPGDASEQEGGSFKIS